MFAYVRAAHGLINERGIIRRPDLVLVADDTLVASPAAGVLSGVTDHTVLLISSTKTPATWQERLNFSGLVPTLPAAAAGADRLEPRLIGAACTGAAARLVGVISRDSLVQAIHAELAPLGEAVVGKNLVLTLEAYERLAAHAGCVTEATERPADTYERPGWIELPFEDASLSAPVIPAAATSEAVPTGQWRTMRPVIDYQRCKRCAWICSTFCPEGNISLNQAGYPQIDYEHCKGCLICLAQCPRHAIRAVPEHEAA